jgi:ketosteroid isomerase-like protein
MRKIIAISTVLCVVVLALFSAAHARAQNNAAVEQQIRDIITQFTTAYGVNDLGKYFSYYADDMTWWGPNGNRNEADGNKPKANYQKSYPESVKRSGGLAGSKLIDLRVQVSPQGDAAIASYRLDVVRKNPDPNATPPRPANVSYEMTAALFKRGSDWRVVHLHYQTIPPPGQSTR